MCAEVCSRARQLGLSGEAAAAEQTLAERKEQASLRLIAAAATGSAAAYQAAMATAEATAVEAAVLAKAAASFTARCTEATKALSTAARTGSWTEFASARDEAVFLQQEVQLAEAAMSQRRNTASTAVAAAVDCCMEGLSLEQAWLLMSERVHADRQTTTQSTLLPCAECSGLTASSHIGRGPAGDHPPQGPVTPTGLFQASVDSRDGHIQCLIIAITQAISTVPMDADQLDWEAAVTALSDTVSPAKAAVATGRSQPTQSNPAVTLADALIEARHLGLLQTVELALQILLAQAKLQLQSHEAVVAEFDLPTEEHPQEMCTTAWQHPKSAQQVMHQDTACQIATSVLAEAHNEPPADTVSLAGLVHWDRCAAEVEVEQAQVSRHLVAKLQAGDFT